MARLAGTIHRFIGTSQEVKPYVGKTDVDTGAVLTELDVPVGSIFYEEDTGWEYTYRGAGTWEMAPDAARTHQLLSKLDEVVEVLKEGLQEQIRLSGHLANGSALTSKEALELAKE